MNTPEPLRDPNDGAFIETETRTGPPLNYVAEKLRSCLEELHATYNLSRRDLPDDLPRPRGAPSNYSTKDDSVLSPCFGAFNSALVSYLALNNILALANDRDIEHRLLDMSREDFKRWLDDIDREGSVT
jgi:hypothetical protein